MHSNQMNPETKSLEVTVFEELEPAKIMEVISTGVIELQAATR